MKARGPYCLQAAAVVTGTALVVAFGARLAVRQYTASSARDLAMRTAGNTKLVGDRIQRGWGRRPLTTAFADACWAKARADMLAAGAAPREADTVLRAARAEAEHPHGWGARPFSVPSVVRRGRAAATNVCAFRLQWETLHLTGARGAAALCHFRILVLDANPPHALLGETHCG